MNKWGQKPSFEGYTEPEAKKENMMNVGELDKKFFAGTTPVKKRNKPRRRPQGNRNQENAKLSHNKLLVMDRSRSDHIWIGLRLLYIKHKLNPAQGCCR